MGNGVLALRPQTTAPIFDSTSPSVASVVHGSFTLTTDDRARQTIKSSASEMD